MWGVPLHLGGHLGRADRRVRSRLPWMGLAVLDLRRVALMGQQFGVVFVACEHCEESKRAVAVASDFIRWLIAKVPPEAQEEVEGFANTLLDIEKMKDIRGMDA